MTREAILRKALDMASHNLLCCSANLAMTKPNEGYEEQHKAYAEEVKVLEEWIAEMISEPISHQHRQGKQSMKTYTIHVMEARGREYESHWRLLANNVRARSPRAALRIAAPITNTYYNEYPVRERPHPGLMVYEFSKARYAVEQTA